MRFWFDTEFYEDGRTIELISIGVVSETGSTFYAETPKSKELARSTEWLAQNVLPGLTIDSRHIFYRWQIANALVAMTGDAPEIWAYYADYDWVALCQLFGTMMDLPKGWPMYCRDIKQLCDSLGNPKLPPLQGTEHNALNDAVWARQAYNFLTAFQSTAVPPR